MRALFVVHDSTGIEKPVVREFYSHEISMVVDARADILTR
jgi:hypothetical protein